MRHQEKKEKYNTAYGPIEDDSTYEQRISAQRAKKVANKHELLDQIVENKEQIGAVRESAICVDEQYNKINNDAQAVNAERQIKLRNDTVTHWKDEISFDRQIRDKKNKL